MLHFVLYIESNSAGKYRYRIINAATGKAVVLTPAATAKITARTGVGYGTTSPSPVSAKMER